MRPLGFTPAAASHSVKINDNSFVVEFTISWARTPEYRSSSVCMLREFLELIADLCIALSSIKVKVFFEARTLLSFLLGSTFVICLRLQLVYQNPYQDKQIFFQKASLLCGRFLSGLDRL